jgi:auxin-responsive protein IAA
MEEYRKLELRLGPPGEFHCSKLHGAKRTFNNPDAEDSANRGRINASTKVVGWPPIRSFRKNLAGSLSNKRQSNDDESTGKKKDLFVKVNMEGIPIGRKININAYDSYSKLSYAIDELFRALLAAQNDSSNGDDEKKMEEAKGGSLAEGGDYTLVYEDNEGDRILVGDVPWQMFVTTVKRLRVLKSSTLQRNQ